MTRCRVMRLFFVVKNATIGQRTYRILEKMHIKKRVKCASSKKIINFANIISIALIISINLQYY